MNITFVIWWVGLALFFIFFWQIAKALQSVATTFRKFEELIKKFENFKLTELPPVASVPPPLPVSAPASVSAAPVAVSPSAPAVDRGGIPGEIVAVIAAAVDAVMAGPHRILAINPISGPNPYQTSLAWAAEGRRHIFQSHKLR
ncbi:MAG: hypothetical protein LBK60_06875 [Verrucomicrobiales bacterium]|nr:hypothetical protein [Verrucomicrobiales bacterium]